MCYRYTLKSLAAVTELNAKLSGQMQGSVPGWSPRYNVALTNLMPVITRHEDGVVLETMGFGFTLPARPPGGKPMLLGNARAETLLAKPSFRAAAQHRRCLVPADGFYEWEKQGATRLPHYFTLQDDRPFFFAGIWEPAREETPAAFCIVTTSPNALLQTIHDRMPVLLGPNSGPVWLGNQPLEPAQLTRICRPLPAEMMTGHRVDPRVNHVRYDAADCVAPI